MDSFKSIIDEIIINNYYYCCCYYRVTIIKSMQSIDNEAVQNAFMLFTCHIRCVPAMDCFVALLSTVPVCIVQRSKIPWRLNVVLVGGNFSVLTA